MFKCQPCGKQSAPHEGAYRVVVEEREKVYPDGTKGFETVKEILVCAECAA